MNVVIVNESIPFPATSGSRIRTLNLMIRLARRHRISYLCRGDADRAATRDAADFLHAHGIHGQFVDDPPRRKSGVGFYGRLAGNLMSSLPYAVTSHNSAALRAAISHHAANHSVDLWQFEWLGYADALARHPRAKTVLMAHNIESQIWERYHGVESARVKRWYLRDQWRKFERLERRLFVRATAVVAVSEQDAQLARRFGARNIAIVENGIDSTFFGHGARPKSPKSGGPRDTHRILFLGSLDWRPNQDAVKLLLEHIFPQILAGEPRARLMIVGRNPPAWMAQQIQRHRRVELHADVADVRPFLASSGVMVVPLRIGGGSRLKILEALACGLPVVSTRVGCEGLDLSHGSEITVADGNVQMAAALIDSLRHPTIAAEKARRGQALVLDRYDWDVLGDKLENVWLDTAGPLPRTVAESQPATV